MLRQGVLSNARESGNDPGPLRRGQMAELYLDVLGSPCVHDGRIGGIGGIDSHEQVHNAVERQDSTVDLAADSTNGVLVIFG